MAGAVLFCTVWKIVFLLESLCSGTTMRVKMAFRPHYESTKS
jgi:hypothetical protein